MDNKELLEKANKQLENNYDKKILALKEQIQRIIGGIEVLEKLKEEITTPNEKE